MAGRENAQPRKPRRRALARAGLRRGKTFAGLVEQVKDPVGDREEGSVELELPGGLALPDEREASKVGEADLDALQLQRPLRVFGGERDNTVPRLTDDRHPAVDEAVPRSSAVLPGQCRGDSPAGPVPEHDDMAHLQVHDRELDRRRSSVEASAGLVRRDQIGTFRREKTWPGTVSKMMDGSTLLSQQPTIITGGS
jgi:hypothetical protein